jgi:hypothetical protein
MLPPSSHLGEKVSVVVAAGMRRRMGGDNDALEQESVPGAVFRAVGTMVHGRPPAE